MYLLGISAFYHNSACCLFKDDQLICALQEERLSRIKGDASFPILSIRAILDQNNLSIKDIDLICYYENPKIKFERQLEMNLTNEELYTTRQRFSLVKNVIRHNLGYEKEIFYSDHHLSHLGNGIYQSTWKEASFLCIDSVGEKNCITWGHYDNLGIHRVGQIDFPHSMGILYSAMTAYLGFSVNDEEFKMMGLAAFGDPLYAETISKHLIADHGQLFKLNQYYFNVQNPSFLKMYAEDEWIKLFKIVPRAHNEDILQVHKDLASSIQQVLENEVTQILQSAFPIGAEKLIFCGGVAHNSMLNHKLSKLAGFKNVFIPAAPNDVGSSIGACIMAMHRKNQKLITLPERKVPTWGLKNLKVKLSDLEEFIIPHNFEKLSIALKLGSIAALCLDRMEFGDRALGNRSIIADPGYPGIKDIINKKIKRREEFRPFAPVVIMEKANLYFDMIEENKLMTKIYQVKPEYSELLAGITNVDGSARVQTLREEDNKFLHSLLKVFEAKSGYPVLLNTSLNLNGEPIAEDEQDAVDIFLRSEIDILILERGQLAKADLPSEFVQLYKGMIKTSHQPLFKTTYEFL